MTQQDKPQIRLKPKANARLIRHGYPWIYDADIVTDRRTRALDPGTVCQLQDSERKPLAIVAFNPHSRLMARVLDRNVQAEINIDWLHDRIARALEMRERLFDQPYYRLIHAEADGLPGVVIDRFGDICVLQPNAVWAENLLEPLTEALTSVTGIKTVLKNASGRVRASERLDDQSAVLCGMAPDAPIPVQMNGATYLADLTEGQKTGLFYDQRPNHNFAAGLARDAEVLDVFSHVGGFALAALAGGAKTALSVDGSAPALKLAEAGAAAMGVEDRFTTRKGDAFDQLGTLAEEGRQFDVVICDPPAFAPTKKALEAGLRAYERVARLAAVLVRPGGYLGLCSCSHAASLPKFHAACTRGIGRAGRDSQLIHTGFAGPDHPQHPQLAESGYLKALFFRL